MTSIALGVLASTLSATVAAADDAAPRASEPRVDRGPDGRVTAVRSGSGRPVRSVARGTGPAAAALEHARAYAPAFGLGRDDLEVAGTARGRTGSLVRLQQTVDGLPVVGGELVASLAPDGGLLSLSGEVADPAGASVTEPGVSEVRAREVARAAVAGAKGSGRTADDLRAVSQGTWAYDPALLGAPDTGTRRVWRVEVDGGPTVHQTVLVDALSGRVALRLDEVREALDRVVCDGANVRRDFPTCAGSTAQVRTETSAASSVAQAERAFEISGATAQMYADVAGLDLTSLLGTGSAPKLAAWVRFCPLEADSPDCPMANAFWSGGQIYLGDGFAGADDVVAHELTHGVIERYSDLFYFHQSGAINESLADVMGEILDHRWATSGDSPSDWRLGETAPGGAIRDLANPARLGQPDSMTSALWDADPGLLDNGGVHTNSGVGNKAAYLISQGGTFNGVTMTGLDAGDLALTRTAVLYSEVIRRLSSGASYADLAATLEQTCLELAATTGTGFDAAACETVRGAVAATRMSQRPTVPGAAPVADAPSTCLDGQMRFDLLLDEGFGSAVTRGSLWASAPNATYGIPGNARTGRTSLFGFDPDPRAYGDPYSSALTMQAVQVPTDRQTYVHFDQWRLFEYAGSSSPVYYDGGTVDVLTASDPAGPWTARTLPSDAWVNGPRDALRLAGSTPVTGFGGDSHGWTSSRLDLSSLAGQYVKVRWTVRGDASGSFIGWFLDDLNVYSCLTPGPPPDPTPDPDAVPPGPVASLTTATSTAGRVTVRWTPPTEAGNGEIVGYDVTRSDGFAEFVPAGTRSVSYATNGGRSYSFRVGAVSTTSAGATRVVRVFAPSFTNSFSPGTSVRKGTVVTVKGTITPRTGAGTSTASAAGRYVRLQWRPPGLGPWSERLPSGQRVVARVGSDNRYVLKRAVGATLELRVVMSNYPDWFSGKSSGTRVSVR